MEEPRSCVASQLLDDRHVHSTQLTISMRDLQGCVRRVYDSRKFVSLLAFEHETSLFWRRRL